MSVGEVQLGYYVDFQSPDKSWQVAQVKELSSAGLKLCFTVKDRVVMVIVQPNSHMIALFRTRTLCGSSLERTQIALEDMQSSLTSVIQEQLNYGEMHSIVQLFRGTLYFFTVELLTTVPDTRTVVEQTLTFLQTLVGLAECWLSKLPDYLCYMPRILRDAKAIYSCGEAATASIYPELFALLGRLLKPEKEDVLLKVRVR